ncbi:MAG: DUF4168 domain-containing protein [Desulfobulbaceae bacterium]|nr:DUF4168 domain-containing protein [Desulfobulbaceae bacterium]
MMKRITVKNRKVLFGIIFAGAVTMMTAPVFAEPGLEAQEQGAAQESTQQDQAAMDFDEQTLEKYAAAQVQLEVIQNDFMEKLQEAQDQEKLMELHRDKNNKMAKVVQGEGLDVETYNTIASQIMVDTQLKNKVELQKIKLLQVNN